MTIDWKNAPEGATHYSPETDATHAVFYKDDFKQMWIEKWSNLGWQEAHSLNEHERPIPRPTSTGILVSEQTQTLEAELSALRTAAIADAARIAELEASLAARGEALDFMKGAQQEWYEMYMQKRDAISRFKAGLVRAGARVPIDAMTMNANEQGLTAALVYLESELDQAAKRKYDLASIVSRGEQDDEN